MEGKLDASTAEALLALLPADGSAIGNSALRAAIEKKLGRSIKEYAYNAWRDQLVEQGTLAKGAFLRLLLDKSDLRGRRSIEHPP